MKMMRPKLMVAPFVVALFGIGNVASAVTIVDWLQLAPGATPSSFSLTDDGGGAVVSGSLSTAPGEGIPFPGYPSMATLTASGWSTPPAFSDSMAGVPQVSLVNVRVVPQSGAANYQIEMTVPANVELILVVGGLYASDAGSTNSVITTAMTDSGSGVFELVEMIGWSNGVKVDTQALTWNESLSTLSTVPGSEGESGYALFRISPLVGENPRLLLSVPEGLGSGVGDEISFGVAVPVPEPSVHLLLAATAMLGCLRRRR
ncbi:hypothetical protein ACFQY0_04095 [Haloferula chungangensis]|uniref:Ice-binding protein C-terminal domain-containing protein n=2 Tax=Haloferula chungangensis TaxID=1048331 RepID=A0ABW2L208_9BACT